MSEYELECALSRKLNESVGGHVLSADFCGRLQASVRRMRHRLVMKVIAAILAVIAAVSVSVGLRETEDSQEVREPSLIATETHHTETNLSKLAFLGFFRECFKRNKTTKRKEDEQ